MFGFIEGGVLEDHPQLRVGFLESGCAWLSYWLWRLDEEYKNLHWEVERYGNMLSHQSIFAVNVILRLANLNLI
ncbi:hypothetical protein [Okeania sp. SIO2C9]|uniref:hypothetical protein n=1 Tax=Okeania sp. SIO2C9 TaxID=2607791 RepID=UPI0025D3D0A7|nr:hypothetical protein [Okeania sp. SIO2C9]